MPARCQRKLGNGSRKLGLEWQARRLVIRRRGIRSSKNRRENAKIQALGCHETPSPPVNYSISVRGDGLVNLFTTCGSSFTVNASHELFVFLGNCHVDYIDITTLQLCISILNVVSLRSPPTFETRCRRFHVTTGILIALSTVNAIQDDC